MGTVTHNWHHASVPDNFVASGPLGLIQGDVRTVVGIEMTLCLSISVEWMSPAEIETVLSRQKGSSGLGCWYWGLFTLWFKGLKDIKKTPTHPTPPLPPMLPPADPREWVNPAARTRTFIMTQGTTTLIPGCEREGEPGYNRCSRSVAGQWLNSSRET